MSEFFRIIRVEGTPLEMGRAYGRQTADLIRDFVLQAKRFYHELGYSEAEVQQIRERHEDGIGGCAPEIIQEIRGMAEGAGVSYASMMDACVQREMRDGLVHHDVQTNCTICVAGATASSHGKTTIGHNWDSRAISSHNIVVTVARPKDGFRFVTIGPIGRPGCEGMNEKGLVIVMSGVVQRGRKEFLRGNGPMYVSPEWTHHVFRDSRTVGDALSHCKNEYLNAVHGVNWVVSDSKGSAHAEIAHAAMNIAYLDTDSSDPKDLAFSTANHYASSKLSRVGPTPEEDPASYARKRRMNELLTSNLGRIDVDLTQRFLRDHQLPHPICRHGHGGWYTISSEVARPADREFWIAFGPPCRNDYRPLLP